MPPTAALSRCSLGALLAVISCLGAIGCGTSGNSGPRSLPLGPGGVYVAPVSASPTVPPSRPDELRTVTRVARHWFSRYRARYGETVRLETVVPHVDSPTRADVFVIATFRHSAADPSTSGRPADGRYYRSVQLEFRHARWHIESVRPA